MASITFHGAAGGVTGSCHLVQVNGKQILLDCGQFQGPWEVERQNFRPFEFQPADLDAVILSHGHLDHCGRIPVLTRQGFSGHVCCTPPTRDIARLILLDSAHVHKEEYLWKARRLGRAGIQAEGPLYTAEDAYYSMDRFDWTLCYGEPLALGNGLNVGLRATDAGHILGSAQVYVDYTGDGGSKRRLLYTGDLGDGDRPVVRDPDRPEPPVHALIMEATYGDRDHRSYADSVNEFETAVLETVRRRGTVLIPSFALERTQEILFHLGEMHRSGRLSPDVPVFLNSPLAIDITRLYHQHAGFCRQAIREHLDRGRSPFVFPGLHLTETVEESRAIHSVPDPKIVIAGSGMMTGGRVKHHLKHSLWKTSTALIVVGYQAAGTLGRKIIEGAETVRIFGETVAVKASIHTINGFSAHAGRSRLIEYARTARPEKVFLVHGEPEAAASLARALQAALPGSGISVPAQGEHAAL